MFAIKLFEGILLKVTAPHQVYLTEHLVPCQHIEPDALLKCIWVRKHCSKGLVGKFSILSGKLFNGEVTEVFAFQRHLSDWAVVASEEDLEEKE